MPVADITNAAGETTVGVMTAIKDGFGNTLKSTGIIIGLGVMMGGILEVSGAAEQLAFTFIRVIGKRKEEWALAITGWVVSIPVFADSAIVIFAPLVKAMSSVTGISVVGLPVYGGASHITTRGVIRLVKICEEVGVDAVSVLTPMFVSQTQDELYNYYKTIAENTTLPIIMYNNKPKTNVTITPATVAKLADIENIVAVKDSTGDMTNAAEYIRLTRGKDFSVLMGRDTLIYAALCYGATGAIASCANVAPRIAADIYDKYVAGDLEGALEAQFTLAPFRIACGMGTFPAAIKEGLVQEGIPVGKCLDPIGELTPEEKEKLHKVLADMNLV